MKRRLPLIALVLVFLAIACFSAYQLFAILMEYRQGEQSYKELEQYVTIETPAPTEQQPGTDDQPEPEDGIAWPEVDFDALRAQNEDIVGWIYLEGTPINYPVVRGDDNDYYLRRLYDGTPNGSGSIFMDFRNEPNFIDRNNILYGHSMNNGSMFTAIKKYKNQAFYDEHPYALLMTPDGNYKLEFFTGYIANVEQDAWNYYFDTDEEFQFWLDSGKSKSTFASTVTPTVEDRVVTLSTCTYEFNNARYVLVGVLR